MGCRNGNSKFQWGTAPPGKCCMEVIARYRCFRNIKSDRLHGAWEVVVQHHQGDGLPRGVRRERGLATGGCVFPALHPGCSLLAVPHIVPCAKRFV